MSVPLPKQSHSDLRGRILARLVPDHKCNHLSCVFFSPGLNRKTNIFNVHIFFRTQLYVDAGTGVVGPVCYLRKAVCSARLLRRAILSSCSSSSCSLAVSPERCAVFCPPLTLLWLSQECQTLRSSARDISHSKSWPAVWVLKIMKRKLSDKSKSLTCSVYHNFFGKFKKIIN